MLHNRLEGSLLLLPSNGEKVITLVWIGIVVTKNVTLLSNARIL